MYGSWGNAPGKPTVLIYAHYDVQPVKETEWAIPPFAQKVTDKEGNMAVEGFYDNVVPATAQENEMMKKIPYSQNDDMKILGTIVEVGDTSFSSLERIWFRPTLEIIGMQSSYTAAEGHSNIIPGNAMARITCRLVNNQSGADILDLIVKHINKNLPVGATATYKFIRGKGGASPMKFTADTKEYKYVADVLAEIYGKQPIQVGTGGSIGPLLLQENATRFFVLSILTHNKTDY